MPTFLVRYSKGGSEQTARVPAESAGAAAAIVSNKGGKVLSAEPEASNHAPSIPTPDVRAALLDPAVTKKWQRLISRGVAAGVVMGGILIVVLFGLLGIYLKLK